MLVLNISCYTKTRRAETQQSTLPNLCATEYRLACPQRLTDEARSFFLGSRATSGKDSVTVGRLKFLGSSRRKQLNLLAPNVSAQKDPRESREGLTFCNPKRLTCNVVTTEMTNPRESF